MTLTNERSQVKKSSTQSGMVSIRRETTEELWCYSTEPIKQPLLKKLESKNSEINGLAISAFNCCLKYMGDLPFRRNRSGAFNELTDEIFSGPLKYVSVNKLLVGFV